MAAGRGARMMPLTNVIPKPMAPYRGTTLIADGIRKIRPYIENIHITVGYKGKTLAEHVVELGVSSVFNTAGKGNAWWIYNTLMKHLNEPIVVLTCDNVVDLEFDEIATDYDNLNQPACMVVPVKPVLGLEGDYIFQKDNIVLKLDRNDPSDSYCSGIQIINPSRINALTKETEDFYVVWDQLISQQQLYASNICLTRWFTVDTIEQLNELNSDTASHLSRHATPE
jgi:NDP-sugar pyrophosphorylase family protein